MKVVHNLAFATVLIVGTSIFPSVAQAQRNLGGVNIDAYCKNRFGSGARAVLVENTAWGWRCRIRQDLVSLSIDNACRFQYQNQRAYAQTRNSRDPYSWVCLSN